jgi:hypothetical protein
MNQNRNYWNKSATQSSSCSCIPHLTFSSSRNRVIKPTDITWSDGHILRRGVTVLTSEVGGNCKPPAFVHVATERELNSNIIITASVER